MKKQKKTKKTAGVKPKTVETPQESNGECDGRDCPFHGNLKARGKTFEGIVVKKLPKRLTIEFERMNYIKKYERYLKSRTKVHARLPKCLEGKINVGDTILIRECRPLSKIIHFVVVKKIKSGENGK